MQKTNIIPKIKIEIGIENDTKK